MHKTISPSRPKSGRKPLREIHVSGNNVPQNDAPSKPGNNIPPDSTGSAKGERTTRRDAGGGGVLDRLLLVKSELGGVVGEINELVTQAFQLKTISKCGKEEADALSALLSEFLSSLKPWSSRLKSALSCPQESLELAEPSSAISVCSPEQDKFDSLISPSPLVSWRDECTIERGRQVFMLTPLLMSKALTTKCRKPPPPAFPKPVSSAVPPLSLTLLEEGNDENASKVEPPAMGEEQSFASPKPVSRKPCSMVAVTPCFKVSPPMSCKLLDPSLDSSCWKDARDRKATPFPLGLRKHDDSLSESDDEGTSEELARKYPELLGIRRDIDKGNREREPSPEWSFSPPKTCVVMEPPAEKSPHDASDSFRLMPVPCNNPRLIEKTPVWRGPKGSPPRRHPGENTLKRELWTRFEAASSYNIPKGNRSNSANSEARGFMDRLDEASLDE